VVLFKLQLSYGKLCVRVGVATSIADGWDISVAVGDIANVWSVAGFDRLIAAALRTRTTV